MQPYTRNKPYYLNTDLTKRIEHIAISKFKRAAIFLFYCQIMTLQMARNSKTTGFLIGNRIRVE